MIYRMIVIGIGILLFVAGILDIKSRMISRRMIAVLFLASCCLFKIILVFLILWAGCQSVSVQSGCQLLQESRSEREMAW